MNGSPTVSPVTAALCVSLPFPPKLPNCVVFFPRGGMHDTVREGYIPPGTEIVTGGWGSAQPASEHPTAFGRCSVFIPDRSERRPSQRVPIPSRSGTHPRSDHAAYPHHSQAFRAAGRALTSTEQARCPTATTFATGVWSSIHHLTTLARRRREARRATHYLDIFLRVVPGAADVIQEERHHNA